MGFTKYEILHSGSLTKSLHSDDIFALSRELAARNKELKVNGELLFLEREFIQILEGEKSTIEKLMAIVRSDSRHGSIKVIWEGEIDDYGYENWGISPKMNTLLDDYQVDYAIRTDQMNTSKELFDQLSKELDSKFLIK